MENDSGTHCHAFNFQSFSMPYTADDRTFSKRENVQLSAVLVWRSPSIWKNFPKLLSTNLGIQVAFCVSNGNIYRQ